MSSAQPTVPGVFLFFLLLLLAAVLVCVFFQAEDGIRDHCVTGVQTCALPIYKRRCAAVGWILDTDSGRGDSGRGGVPHLLAFPRSVGTHPAWRFGRRTGDARAWSEIGRASCRERV